MKRQNFKTAGIWEKLIEEQKVSGIPISEFCSSRGFSTGSFYSALNRLRRRVSKPPTDLIPMKVVAPSEFFRVCLTNGITLELTGRPEPEWISKFLKVLV